MATEVNNILCMDFSSSYLVVAGYIRGREYSFVWETERTGAEKVWDVLRAIFYVAGQGPDVIDVYGLGIGPGYFTSMRISLSILKGFNLAGISRIVIIPSYDIIAYGVGGINKLCVSFDARKNLFYSACYQRNNGRLKKISSEKLIDYRRLQKIVKKKFYLCGDAVNFLSRQDKKEARVVHPYFWRINPHIFIDLCRQKALKGEFSDIEQVNLLYLHSQICQVGK